MKTLLNCVESDYHEDRICVCLMTSITRREPTKVRGRVKCNNLQTRRNLCKVNFMDRKL